MAQIFILTRSSRRCFIKFTTIQINIVVGLLVMNFRMIIVAALGRQISIVGQAEIVFLYNWEEFCKISYLIQETDLFI